MGAKELIHYYSTNHKKKMQYDDDVNSFVLHVHQQHRNLQFSLSHLIIIFVLSVESFGFRRYFIE